MDAESRTGGLIVDIKQFLQENDVLQSNSLIEASRVNDVEKAIGIKVGQQLIEYITTYGYLIFEDVELYGITACQGLESDLIKQTLYLHKYFPITKGYIALENQGDGDYYIVDSTDTVYEFFSEQDKLTNTGLKLFDYIVKRFEDAIL